MKELRDQRAAKLAANEESIAAAEVYAMALADHEADLAVERAERAEIEATKLRVDSAMRHTIGSFQLRAMAVTLTQPKEPSPRPMRNGKRLRMIKCVVCGTVVITECPHAGWEKEGMSSEAAWRAHHGLSPSTTRTLVMT